jgi:hypothetical protein
VRDVGVVSAQPEGVFDAASRSALRGWRFPIAAGGELRTQRFDFNLATEVEENAGSGACNRPATGSRVCRRGPAVDDGGLTTIDGGSLRR